MSSGAIWFIIILSIIFVATSVIEEVVRRRKAKKRKETKRKTEATYVFDKIVYDTKLKAHVKLFKKNDNK